MNQIVNTETIDAFAIALPGVTQGFPFDEKVLVYKVGGKIFALLDVEDFWGVNLKCDPERAVELREHYDGVKPGYHMNKVHWNTVTPVPDSDVDAKLFWELLIHSYELVRTSLTKKILAGLPEYSK
jgi:predicted DNA-binding protein (MmcQ/YjbR family)